ncbi:MULTISPECIES: histone deacetylase [Thiomicrorhabdus]|uniref:Histone deacetylase n=1 Tax=Thiomicrorhabdus heinhorstiae TaxID=2748010 RepID=A0ABS0BYP1_9GAMM|nr:MULTISPECIES: histone deacetylase [Thiomicrorhabdus]MBF6058918.1 histone deacetylase [Thiomicrorhabdus heinhorstiae]
MDRSRRSFLIKSLLLSLGATSQEAFAASKNNQARKVGVVLDPLFFKHDLLKHPESAARLVAIDEELSRRKLWSYLTPIKSRLVADDELLSVHKAGYVFEIDTLSESGGGYYDEYSQDTYLNRYSAQAARMAAGGNIELNLAVYDRKVDYGFGLFRPPGHHAKADKAMGFCLFNSDVIAAKALQKQRGVERIAIIDFDVHHGNGTQDLTINDPSIMAISIHQHPYWPMTGFAEHQGEGKAAGMNVNCPFHKGAGDQTYLQVFDSVIAPKLEQFQPQHIIVFAGYDGHWQDPLAGHQLSVQGYNRLVKRCVETAETLCGGRISFSLGGGYHRPALAQCVAGSFHTLLGLEGPFADPIGSSTEKELDYTDQIENLRELHLKA